MFFKPIPMSISLCFLRPIRYPIFYHCTVKLSKLLGFNVAPPHTRGEAYAFISIAELMRNCGNGVAFSRQTHVGQVAAAEELQTEATSDSPAAETSLSSTMVKGSSSSAIISTTYWQMALALGSSLANFLLRSKAAAIGTRPGSLFFRLALGEELL